jgi:hypothetical protein
MSAVTTGARQLPSWLSKVAEVYVLVAMSKWIEATSFNTWVVVNESWLLPTVQTVHILCLALVLYAVSIINLRMIGFGAKRLPVFDLYAHFCPWILCSTGVMALTGAVMIAGEPGRSLLNPVFQAKMILLGAALTLTFTLGSLVRRNRKFWDTSLTPRIEVRLAGILSLTLWLATAVCGRWIAYVMVT